MADSLERVRQFFSLFWLGIMAGKGGITIREKTVSPSENKENYTNNGRNKDLSPSPNVLMKSLISQRVLSDRCK